MSHPQFSEYEGGTSVGVRTLDSCAPEPDATGCPLESNRTPESAWYVVGCPTESRPASAALLWAMLGEVPMPGGPPTTVSVGRVLELPADDEYALSPASLPGIGWFSGVLSEVVVTL